MDRKNTSELTTMLGLIASMEMAVQDKCTAMARAFVKSRR